MERNRGWGLTMSERKIRVLVAKPGLDGHDRGAKVVATTHYAEIKLYALETPGVENASCEFDVATLRPTYRLITGLPGQSNAFAIAARLGLDRSVIAAAEKLVDPGARRVEDLISRITGEKKINAVGYCIAGTTLGLTLAQSFVQQHHGTIECESSPGHTCFTIRMPLSVERSLMAS